MRACTFSFDDSPEFPGFTDGSTWNGFNNIWVTPAVRDRIVKAFHIVYPDDASDIAMLPVDGGLVSLANGYATQIVHEQEV